MAIIEPTPNLRSIYDHVDKVGNLFAIGQMPELQALIQRANDEYFYWSDLRYRMPDGVPISAEEVWAYLKLGRNVNRKVAPLVDKENRPFTYWIPDSLHRAMSEVDKWSGGMITTDQPWTLPSTERYIISSLMDEAIASSQLEGASTEYRVAKEMLRSGRKPKDEHEQMIVNNWRVMQHIRENVKTKLSIEGLCEIQALLTQDTLARPEEAGKLRTRDDIVVEYRNEPVHEPPKSNTLPSRMKSLCNFANEDEDNRWIHPSIKAAMVHFWIGYDHPFTDGNGRTARAVMYWYLLSRGYVLFQYLSISRHFLRAPGQYVRSYLYTEMDENDLTYFLVFNLSAIRLALQELRKYLHRKHEEMVHANALLHSFRGLNMRQKNLLYHAIQHPDTLYTIEAHRNSHGVAYDTARKDLLALTTKGFLKKKREGKRLLVFLPSKRMLEKLRSA